MTNQRALACIYSLIKDAPETTVNIRLVAVACLCSEKDIAPTFKRLVAEGFFKKRFKFLPVYRITEAGLAAGKQAFEKQEE